MEVTIIINTGKVFNILLDGTSQQGVDKCYSFYSYASKKVDRTEAGVYIPTFYGCGREASNKLQTKSSRRVILTCDNKNNDPTDGITIK